MKVFDKLLKIMTILRSPEGCPWDRKQTHESLKPYLIEEAYEVLEAIDRGDDQQLKEELGDLLLHIVFHAQIAEANGKFSMVDIAETLNEKLVQRHPHVFDEKDSEISTEQVVSNWEHIKAETSNDKKYYVLNGLPASMPALLKAFRIQEKVARFGFDWSNPLDILNKLDEEKNELQEILQTDDIRKIEDELGDLLFTIVNLCRHFDIVPEIALNSTSEKFRSRFKLMEDYLREDGKMLGSVGLKELDEYWEKAKKQVE